MNNALPAAGRAARSERKSIHSMAFRSPLIPCSLGRIILISVRSDTVRRSRAFSVSNSFQPLKLIAAHAAVLLPRPIIGLNRHTDLPRSLINRFALHYQHFNLSRIQHNILGPLSLASHLVVLLHDPSSGRWRLQRPLGSRGYRGAGRKG